MKSFRDIKKVSYILGYKNKSAGPWHTGTIDSKYKDGVCPHCRQYDVELDKFGNCRDEVCRRERIAKALGSGEAIKAPNGTIIWTHGIKIRKDF